MRHGGYLSHAMLPSALSHSFIRTIARSWPWSAMQGHEVLRISCYRGLGSQPIHGRRRSDWIFLPRFSLDMCCKNQGRCYRGSPACFNARSHSSLRSRFLESAQVLALARLFQLRLMRLCSINRSLICRRHAQVHIVRIVRRMPLNKLSDRCFRSGRARRRRV